MDKERFYVGIDISQDNLDIASYPTEQIWKYKTAVVALLKQ